MKNLITILALTAIPVLGRAQVMTDRALYQELISKDPAVFDAAYAEVLQHTSEHGAVVLIVSAGRALQKGDRANSLFFYYAARLRTRFDLARFPPTQSGGDSPLVALQAAMEQVGQVLTRDMFEHPDALSRALDKIEAWKPRIANDYSPGWPFSAAGDESLASKAVESSKEDLLRTLRPICKLLNDRRYFQAYKTVRAYHLHDGGARPSKPEFDAAVATMVAIENETKLNGLSATAKG